MDLDAGRFLAPTRAVCHTGRLARTVFVGSVQGLLPGESPRFVVVQGLLTGIRRRSADPVEPGSSFISQPIKRTPSVRIVSRQPLFSVPEGPYGLRGGLRLATNYHVATDGRFLVTRAVADPPDRRVPARDASCRISGNEAGIQG